VSLDARRRIDVVVFEDAAVSELARWPDVPFRGPRKVLFSRSPNVDAAAATVFAVPVPATASRVDGARSDGDFWIDAETAVRKVVRGDHLIAAHVAFDLVRQCLQLEMRARDLQAGTRHHPHGASSDAAALAWAQSTMHDLSAEGILHTIAGAAVRFDELRAWLDPTYEPHGPPLLAAIERARATIRKEPR
jgi:hypothetical protein